MRSERREACQVVLEVIFRHLDLASMCLGTPTPASGFIDIDMRAIVLDSGIGQRRCERAIALLKEAGFMRVKQPRRQNKEGAYFGCRAIRIVTETLFEALGLGPMLRRERARASERLRRKAQKMNKKLSDLMGRMRDMFKAPAQRIVRQTSAREREEREQRTLVWNRSWGQLVLQGMDSAEAQRETNNLLGIHRATALVRNIAPNDGRHPRGAIFRTQFTMISRSFSGFFYFSLTRQALKSVGKKYVSQGQGAGVAHKSPKGKN